MTPLVGFILFLVVTLAFLGATVATGLKAHRKAHLRYVVGSIVSLGIAVYYAEKLGETLDLESAGKIYPIHLVLAKTAVAAYLLPVISGIRTLRNPAGKTLHRRIAFLVLGLTVLTAITGVWMVIACEPLEPPIRLEGGA
ncbi:MAG: heme A synthase [Planctomycetota bacterium]|jgi:heme A synthase